MLHRYVVVSNAVGYHGTSPIKAMSNFDRVGVLHLAVRAKAKHIQCRHA